MIKVNYYLESKKRNANSFLAIYISCNGFRVKKNLGISISKNNWNFNKQRFKRSFKFATEYNRLLDYYTNQVLLYYQTQLVKKNPITKELLKNYITELIKPNSKKDNKYDLTIIDVIDLYIETNSNNFKQSTIKNLNTLKKHISEFKPNIKPDNFNDEQTAIDFDKYLIKKGLNNNTKSKINKQLKTILNFSKKQKIIKDDSYKELINSSLEYQPNLIALTEEELTKIINLDLSQDKYKSVAKRLQKVKDIFLIQCFTGLRFSDLQNLKPENIDFKNKIINLYTIKTQKKIQIPIIDFLIPILTKYSHYKIISNQKYNLYLKELCELSGIDDDIQLIKFIGNKRIEKTVPKYSQVSSHTARRTFITIALKRNILPEILMHVTGHTKRETFEKYIKIGQKEAINDIIHKFKGILNEKE